MGDSMDLCNTQGIYSAWLARPLYTENDVGVKIHLNLGHTCAIKCLTDRQTDRQIET